MALSASPPSSPRAAAAAAASPQIGSAASQQAYYPPSRAPLKANETWGGRARECKIQLIIAGVLVALAAVAVGCALGGHTHVGMDKYILSPIHKALGDGGGILLATLVVVLAVRYIYRGINYIANGVYVAEREHDDVDPNNMQSIEGPNKAAGYKTIHERLTVADRIRENWFRVALVAFVVIGAIVLPCVFTQVHSATQLWNGTLWPAMNNHVFTPIHQAMGKVGGILLASVVGLWAAILLYQLGKYITTGTYLANVHYEGTQGAVVYHSRTWFAVSKYL